jgi:hypothetical protein
MSNNEAENLLSKILHKKPISENELNIVPYLGRRIVFIDAYPFIILIVKIFIKMLET